MAAAAAAAAAAVHKKPNGVRVVIMTKQEVVLENETSRERALSVCNIAGTAIAQRFKLTKSDVHFVVDLERSKKNELHLIGETEAKQITRKELHNWRTVLKLALAMNDFEVVQVFFPSAETSEGVPIVKPQARTSGAAKPAAMQSASS